MPRVSVDGLATPAAIGASLFECAELLDVRVPTSCVKQGRCRECLVEVEAGMDRLTPRSPEETALAEPFRLACRARLARDGEVRAHTLRRGALKIEQDAEGLEGLPAIDPAVVRDGSRVLYAGEPIATWEGPLLGLAVDVGTTTVAIRLLDLETGRALARHAFENPQRFGGSDVMARIRYDGDHPGRLLQRTLLGYLTHAIEALPCDPRGIFEIVVVGNPTMRDLLFGLDVQPIGQKPYRSTTEAARRAGDATTTSLTLLARRLRLPAHPEARVHALPLIASHVGADAAAALLATGLGSQRSGVRALMDIGTNTEVVVGNASRLLAASCPAGPAFEGGGLGCGMPALDGAIERVRLGDDGRFAVEVIGEGPPLGLCGSGIVDLLAALLRSGRMNAQGRFDDEAGGRVVVDAAAGVALSEADVSELAQAKGANATGLRILLERYGVADRELEVLYLAGGFARHLDARAAREIGLIPDLPGERIVQVGNAALEGACIALLSVSRRRALEDLVARVEHVELETDPRFFDHFVEGCQFAPLRAGNG